MWYKKRREGLKGSQFVCWLLFVTLWACSLATSFEGDRKGNSLAVWGKWLVLMFTVLRTSSCRYAGEIPCCKNTGSAFRCVPKPTLDLFLYFVCVLVAGWLEKKNPRGIPGLKQWKRRWCVIGKDDESWHFSYYERKNDKGSKKGEPPRIPLSPR